MMSVAAILSCDFDEVENESSVPFHECHDLSVGSEDDMIDYLDNKYLGKKNED